MTALIAAIGIAFTAPCSARSKWQETVLHSFGHGGDGQDPIAPLVKDKRGNFYGTTDGAHSGGIHGTIFEIDSTGTESILYGFKGGSDGEHPASGLLLRQGNLYGTTAGGGGTACGGHGCGTVFSLAPDGTESVLHAFSGGSDGLYPYGSLIADTSGNLYGTTFYGGGYGCQNVGCGTAFKLSPDGKETVLHAFTGENGDGAGPNAGLVADQQGNLYGTTTFGGESCPIATSGCGIVFKLAPDGTETVLYAFTGENGDGGGSYGALIEDDQGNFYGTTAYGGAYGYGTVFSLSADDLETVLYSFKGGSSDGLQPRAGLVADTNGHFYGTTYDGGGSGCEGYGCGVAFKVTLGGQETVLHIFTDDGDGGHPWASLIIEKGNLYGTAQYGGSRNRGVVFELSR